MRQDAWISCHNAHPTCVFGAQQLAYAVELFIVQEGDIVRGRDHCITTHSRLSTAFSPARKNTVLSVLIAAAIRVIVLILKPRWFCSFGAVTPADCRVRIALLSRLIAPLCEGLLFLIEPCLNVGTAIPESSRPHLYRLWKLPTTHPTPQR